MHTTFYAVTGDGARVGQEHKLDRAQAVVVLSEARFTGMSLERSRAPISKAMIGAWIASEKHRRNGSQPLVYLMAPDAAGGTLMSDELTGEECEKLARDFELFVFGVAAKGAEWIRWESTE